MRVLILGVTGMLGHKVWQTAASRWDLYGTVRGKPEDVAKYGLFEQSRLLGGVDAMRFESVEAALSEVRPDVVINCVGVVKQLAAAKDPVVSLTVNSLLPHRLAVVCRTLGARLVHVSTDCVFSGARGMYSEGDQPDADDLYGRSKLLGEVGDEGCLTLRTSLIGRQLSGETGLVEWFLHEPGPVSGYAKAIFSGFTTQAFAALLVEIAERHPQLHGVLHAACDPIDKLSLLRLLRDAYGRDTAINPSDTLRLDRSLDASALRTLTGFVPRPWPEMVQCMAEDASPYNAWRR